jgi:biopolymer transport protein TolR
MGQMNVVPFIDVMLVLLVAFMMTVPLISSGVTVELPRGVAPPIDPRMIEDGDFVVLSIDAHAQLYLNIGTNPDTPIDESQVRDLASAVFGREPSTPAFIRADGAVPYRDYVRGQTLLTQAGASRVIQLVDSSNLEARE